MPSVAEGNVEQQKSMYEYLGRYTYHTICVFYSSSIIDEANRCQVLQT